jgi:hypothetical protein
LYDFCLLKRPSLKSLPSSLFQREESLWGFAMEDSIFSPFEKGGGRGILLLFKRLTCYPEFRILIYLNARKKVIPYYLFSCTKKKRMRRATTQESASISQAGE